MIERLVELGLNQSEARCYLALLQHPEATGYELAKSAGLQRANTYAALESLCEKGFASRTTTDSPARHVAVPPAETLGRLKRQTARRVDTLIADLAVWAAPQPTTAITALHGHDAVADRVLALVDAARERVALCCWSDDLGWLTDALRAAANSGCRVVVNVFGDGDLDVGEVFRHESPDRTVGGHLLLLAVDFRTALVATLDEHPQALQTDQPALVRLVEKLIRDEAYLAAIFEHHRDALEQSFGPHLVDLRSRLLPPDEADRLVSVVGFGAADHTLS
ncbi:MAG: helix-turn-helix domain-containing protein [Micropruina sp.]|uniref:TrmB family transcriptional regulator n=1 Tax=Micropruina sp. TaxID=2737536 RepID=UPI0039E57EE4